jgi:hypothetical protein
MAHSTDFISDEVPACHHGTSQVDPRDADVAIFNRRSGPIAAAIAISIESPGVAAAAASR